MRAIIVTVEEAAGTCPGSFVADPALIVRPFDGAASARHMSTFPTAHPVLIVGQSAGVRAFQPSSTVADGALEDDHGALGMWSMWATGVGADLAVDLALAQYAVFT